MFNSAFTSSPYSDTEFCDQNPYAAALFDPTAVIQSSLSSSLPCSNYFMHRNSSSHSLTHHQRASSVPESIPNPFLSSSPSPAYDLEFHSESFRRVLSTGDLQMQDSTENCRQEGMVTAGRVGRYTAEERMKRIERYRSKRNQRNFHKKITYACRKTLADSRPRVRGRFARNGEPEIETEPEPETEVEASEVSYESYNHHDSYNHHQIHENIGSYSNNNNGYSNTDELWRQMQATLLNSTDEEECCYDDSMWASFDNVFSMNILS